MNSRICISEMSKATHAPEMLMCTCILEESQVEDTWYTTGATQTLKGALKACCWIQWIMRHEWVASQRQKCLILEGLQFFLQFEIYVSFVI